MLRRFKNSSFREPRTGVGRSTGMKFGNLRVVTGCLVAVLSLLSFSKDVQPFYFCFATLLGLTYVLQGLAELLRVYRIGLPGGLRSVSMSRLVALPTVVLGFES